MGVNFKVECPNRPFDEVQKEVARIEKLTHKDYNLYTKLAIKHFQLDISNPDSLESCRNAGDYVISAYYNDPNYNWKIPGQEEFDVLEMCTKAFLVAKFGSDKSLKLSGSPMIVNITSHLKYKI
jgi:hypothetical protein